MKLTEFVQTALREDADYASMSLDQLAGVVYRDWKNVNYAAKPYLEAMVSLNSIKDNYYQDSGYSVVVYFLSNARSWTGPVATAVKAELKKRLKNG